MTDIKMRDQLVFTHLEKAYLLDGLLNVFTALLITEELKHLLIAIILK